MNKKINSFIKYQELKINAECKEKLAYLYQCFMKHKFNLLGSGEVQVDFDITPNGFRGKKYDTSAMRKYGKIHKCLLFRDKKEYEPINWYIDFKSGFFFNPLVYKNKDKCLKIIGKKVGVDIKVPWELGRLYHLVSLALYACVADESVRREIIGEYVNEVTDFIKSNPVGQTVQWSAPMDVSIRIVNLLISFDILKQLDTGIITEEFEQKIFTLIDKSGEYVLQNLEYYGGLGSNHYLSNLVGILYAAAYLPSSAKTDAWLVFGVQELIDQVDKQYYEEGSNFEGSTSYHRLSTEFVLFATALVYGVLCSERKRVFAEYQHMLVDRLKKVGKQKYVLESKDFFPQEYLNKICNAGKFTASVLKQNNEIVQIGDNDSGRLIKLTPVGYWNKSNGSVYEENVLDHRTLLSAMCGVFSNDIFEEYGKALPLERSLLLSLTQNKRVHGVLCNRELSVMKAKEINELPYQRRTCIYRELQKDISLLDKLKMEYYSDIGIVIIRSDRLFLSVVIDTTKNTKLCGHTHNDKLSIEVLVDNQYITRDPGGYIYTAAPKIRNKFRSTMSHNVVHVENKEQNDFVTTFEMRKKARGELLECKDNTVIGKVTYSGVEHIRKIQVYAHEIIITDYVNHPFKVSFANKYYSTGYGKITEVK